MNTELFKEIHDQITSDPQGFDMSSWESEVDICGSPLYQVDGNGAHSKVAELALDLDVDVRLDGSVDFELLGAKLLGLEGSDKRLFYVSEEKAARFVELAAAGDEAAAREVLDL